MKSQRILCIDDCPLQRRLLRNLVIKLEFQADLAFDGVDAICQLIRHKHGFYDLIIADVNMPRMDGIALSRIIAESEYPSELIFYTSESPDRLERELHSKLTNIVEKGNFSKLRDKIHSALSRKSLSESPAIPSVLPK